MNFFFLFSHLRYFYTFLHVYELFTAILGYALYLLEGTTTQKNSCNSSVTFGLLNRGKTRDRHVKCWANVKWTPFSRKYIFLVELRFIINTIILLRKIYIQCLLQECLQELISFKHFVVQPLFQKNETRIIIYYNFYQPYSYFLTLNSFQVFLSSQEVISQLIYMARKHLYLHIFQSIFINPFVIILSRTFKIIIIHTLYYISSLSSLSPQSWNAT